MHIYSILYIWTNLSALVVESTSKRTRQFLPEYVLARDISSFRESKTDMYRKVSQVPVDFLQNSYVKVYGSR